MTLVESITSDLKEMPNAKLVQVARYVRDLMPEVIKKQRSALEALNGSISEETAEALEEALAGSRQLSED